MAGDLRAHAVLSALLVESDGQRDQRHHLGQTPRHKQPAARQLRHTQTRTCTHAYIYRKSEVRSTRTGRAATVPCAVLIRIVQELQHCQQHCSAWHCGVESNRSTGVCMYVCMYVSPQGQGTVPSSAWRRGSSMLTRPMPFAADHRTTDR